MVKTMKELEHENMLRNLTNNCIDDLKKFYGYTHQKTVVNCGRRGDSLAGSILDYYAPLILKKAFAELPHILCMNPENLVDKKRITDNG